MAVVPWRAPGPNDKAVAFVLTQVNQAQDTLNRAIAEAQALPGLEPSKVARLKRYNGLRREVDRTYSRLTQLVRGWTLEQVPLLYARGHVFAALSTRGELGFTVAHKEAIARLADDAYDDVATGLQQVPKGFAERINGQRSLEELSVSRRRLIRATARGGVAQQLILGERSPAEVARDLRDQLWSEGVPVIDRSGKSWSADTYSRMLIRTKSANAFNVGSLNKYQHEGVRRVRVFDGQFDDECDRANGQVWTLKYAFDHVIAHPNCVRAFAPESGLGKINKATVQETAQVAAGTLRAAQLTTGLARLALRRWRAIGVDDTVIALPAIRTLDDIDLDEAAFARTRSVEEQINQLFRESAERAGTIPGGTPVLPSAEVPNQDVLQRALEEAKRFLREHTDLIVARAAVDLSPKENPDLGRLRSFRSEVDDVISPPPTAPTLRDQLTSELEDIASRLPPDVAEEFNEIISIFHHLDAQAVADSMQDIVDVIQLTERSLGEDFMFHAIGEEEIYRLYDMLAKVLQRINGAQGIRHMTGPELQNVLDSAPTRQNLTPMQMREALKQHFAGRIIWSDSGGVNGEVIAVQSALDPNDTYLLKVQGGTHFTSEPWVAALTENLTTVLARGMGIADRYFVDFANLNETTGVMIIPFKRGWADVNSVAGGRARWFDHMLRDLSPEGNPPAGKFVALQIMTRNRDDHFGNWLIADPRVAAGNRRAIPIDMEFAFEDFTDRYYQGLALGSFERPEFTDYINDLFNAGHFRRKALTRNVPNWGATPMLLENVAFGWVTGPNVPSVLRPAFTLDDADWAFLRRFFNGEVDADVQAQVARVLDQATQQQLTYLARDHALTLPPATKESAFWSEWLMEAAEELTEQLTTVMKAHLSHAVDSGVLRREVITDLNELQRLLPDDVTDFAPGIKIGYSNPIILQVDDMDAFPDPVYVVQVVRRLNDELRILVVDDPLSVGATARWIDESDIFSIRQAPGGGI